MQEQMDTNNEMNDTKFKLIPYEFNSSVSHPKSSNFKYEGGQRKAPKIQINFYDFTNLFRL